MKQLTYLILACSFLISCKPTSNIVTSKKEAEKKGIYKGPQKRTTVAATNASTHKATPQKPVSSHAAGATKGLKKSSTINDKNDDDYEIAADNSTYMVKQLINTAQANLGVSYRTGGTNPDSGFDCSGLIFSTFKKFNITLPRSSIDMSKTGRKVDGSEIQKGDLIFFKTNGRSVINHVGMVTEVSDNEIKFIHSSTQRGVIISSTKEPYYQKAFAQANRIIVN